ncbi:MAG TPA: lysoplasmalogenase family protein, partial [Vicinamibacteria bacterium]
MSRVGRPPLLAGVGIATALLYFVGLVAGVPELRVAVKPFPALALASWVALGCGDRPGRLTAAGLALSAAGDLLLELGRVLPGLLAFLAAHVAYVAAFVAAERRPALGRLLPFLAWGMTAFALLRPGLGTMALPVGAYVAVLCTMMWRAAARVGGPSTTALAGLLGLAGAVAFGASDTL